MSTAKTAPHLIRRVWPTSMSMLSFEKEEEVAAEEGKGPRFEVTLLGKRGGERASWKSGFDSLRPPSFGRGISYGLKEIEQNNKGEIWVKRKELQKPLDLRFKRGTHTGGGKKFPLTGHQRRKRLRASREGHRIR